MAVYTEVTDDELRAFLSDYDIGEVVAFKGIAEGVENSNYLLQTVRDPDDTPQNYILTLYEKRVRPEDLPYFLGLMDHLAENGISCPTPIHGRDGEALRELCGRPAAIISFLSGMWPRKIAPRHCTELGVAMAGMHAAGADFDGHRENTMSLASWQDLVAATKDRADEVTPGLSGLIVDELAYITSDWPADLPQGVIHADLFPDNVFFLGERLSGLIDFYFACNDALAYDLAVCMNAWCFEADASLNVTKARALLRGYAGVRGLSRAEYDALPALARGAALRFTLTRLYDWLNHDEDAFVRPKDPRQFLDRLRFHQQVDGPEAYGITYDDVSG
ncbi:MAG: homoserine kinase [Alphaproteobacteria bacterium]|nr:homoserine kinase [Alphaproteobacteria bacterium]